MRRLTAAWVLWLAFTASCAQWQHYAPIARDLLTLIIDAEQKLSAQEAEALAHFALHNNPYAEAEVLGSIAEARAALIEAKASGSFEQFEQEYSEAEQVQRKYLPASKLGLARPEAIK